MSESTDSRPCYVCDEPRTRADFKPSMLARSDYRCRYCTNKRRKVIGSVTRIKYITRITVAVIAKKCRAKGILCTITAADIRDLRAAQQGLCAVSGIALQQPGRGLSGPTWDSPSIDRIVPELGYVKDNVRLTLFCVNSFRGLMSDAEMLTVARAIVNPQHVKNSVQASRNPIPEENHYIQYSMWVTIGNVISRAKVKGVPCSIAAEDIGKLFKTQQGRCFISGISLQQYGRGLGIATWNSPSIDRIVPKLGYLAGNVRILLNCVNSLRGQMDDDQMLAVARAIVDNVK